MISGAPLAPGPLGLTSTQIGKVGETIVAAQLMLTSKGRLSPFLPIADDGGIDLLVYDKATHRSLPVQVKGRVNHGEVSSRPVFQFDVRRATFVHHPGAFLLAVLLDLTYGTVQRGWLIPMSDLEKVVPTGRAVILDHPEPERGFQGPVYALSLRCHGRGDTAPHRPPRPSNQSLAMTALAV